MAPLIEIRDLRKTYELHGRPIEVLRGVSLSLERGELLALVGKSGSGKSTLLHIAGTLDSPSAGRVSFEGRDLFSETETALAALRNSQIGFVFQSHHLLSEFTALENVALPLVMRGAAVPLDGPAGAVTDPGDSFARLAWNGLTNAVLAPLAFAGLIAPRTPSDENRRASLLIPEPIRQRATELLVAVGLGHRLHHLPTELSGGEQQRVAIARALVTRPRLLLADEPTGNLDDATGEEIFRVLVDLNARYGTSAIVVTHSERLAARMPRRLRLVDGQLADG